KNAEEALVLSQRLEQAEHRAGYAEAKIAELQRAQESTLALLEIKRAELREAQAFLTLVDGVDDRQVLQLVRQLNAMIHQTSNSIADTFHSQYEEVQDGGVSEEVYRRLLADFLTPRLLTAIRSFDHRRDSVLTQAALASAMCSYIRWFCNTWDLWLTESPPILQTLYSHISQNEPQSVAGKWRALSRKHVIDLALEHGWRRDMAWRPLGENVADVLLACGAPNAILDFVLQRYGDALRDLVDTALMFQRTAGEQVVSRDFHVVLVEAGSAFDDGRMVDEWSDPTRRCSSTTAQRVVCTTQLGLTFTKGAGRGEAGAGVTEEAILLKPQVVRESSLEEV
ncbi:hypothetical protein BV20DRAFT_902088, partial [Pilatotrama ljubarskyi]